MASRSKKKTTMAKLNREAAVREKRVRKAAKKDARRLEAAAGPIEVEAELEDAPAPDDELVVTPA